MSGARSGSTSALSVRLTIAESFTTAGFSAFTALSTVTELLEPNASSPTGMAAEMNPPRKSGCRDAVPEVSGLVPSVVHT